MQTVRRTAFLGPADHVTLVRAGLTAAFGVLLLVDQLHGRRAAPLLAGVASIALLLDGVDGWIARRTGTASARGARFDMEVDAALVLLLSVAVAPAIGLWALAMGAARYLLLGAQALVPWLRAGVPASRWRKGVAVLQGVVLTVDVASPLPVAIERTATALALALLALSFGTEVWWLHRHRAAPQRVPGSLRSVAAAAP